MRINDMKDLSTQMMINREFLNYIELVMKAYSRYSLYIQYRDKVFHIYSKARVVFLYGTSSAGKSATVEIIRKQAMQQSIPLAVTGTDHVWQLHIYNLFEQFYPLQARLLRFIFSLSEIFYCLWCDAELDRLLIEKALVDDAVKIIKAIFIKFRQDQKLLLKFLLKERRPYFCVQSFLPELKQNKLVIVDVAADKGDIEEFLAVMQTHIIHCKMDIVIVYCPPRQLLERIYKRNIKALDSGNLGQARIGSFPLEQYITLYQPVDSSEDAIDCIEYINDSVIIKLSKISKQLSRLISKEIGEEQSTYKENEWQEAQAQFNVKFGININSRAKIPIKPRCRYHFFVNTATHTARSCGKEIIQTLKIS